MTRPTPTPLVVRLLDLLQEEFGTPLPGSQDTELRAGVIKLLGIAARQQAMRQLIEHDDWGRINATSRPEQ